MFMFKIHPVLLALLCGFTLQSAAQSGPTVRTNLTDLVVGRYSLGAEFNIKPQLSVGLDVDYIARDVFVGSNHPWYPGGDTKKRGIILEPQVRWYPGAEAGRGTYTALSGFFGYARYNPVDEASWGSGFLPPPEWMVGGASLHVGHQLTLGRFLLDGYLGGTWTSEDDMGIYYEDLPLFPQASGLRVSGGLRLGIRTGGRQ